MRYIPARKPRLAALGDVTHDASCPGSSDEIPMIGRLSKRMAVLLLAAMVIGAARSTIPDDTGQRVSVRSPPLRIVSLAPGATEMLFAAGGGDQIVATVDYSDEPPPARQIPRIGDVTAIDMERLVALHPDVAVVWPGGGNPAQIEGLARLGIPVYRQQVNRLADLPDSVRRLGALTGTSALADHEANELKTRVEQLAREYGRDKQPTVLLQVWNRPIYTVGGTHLMSDALRLCGARNVFGDLREQGPVVNTEAVIARDPDIIVAFAPPGEGAAWLADWKRYGTLSAVRNGKLIAFEDPRLIRMGPSAIDGTDALCKRIAAVTR